MSLSYKTEMRADYLYVRTDGTWDYPSMLRGLDVMFDAIEEHQAAKILVDVRTVTGAPSDLERIHHAEMAAEKYKAFLTAGKIKPCRFAYLGNQPQIDKTRLGEATAINRGMNVKVTNDAVSAFDWLVVKPDME